MSECEYELVVLRPEDFEEVVLFLDKHFLPREPLCLGLKIIPVDHYFGKGKHGEAVRASLQSGVSIGARVKANGQLAGIRLSKIIRRGESNDLKHEVELVQAQEDIDTLLEMSLNGVDVFGSEQKLLEMFVLAVAEEHGRKGLGTCLVKECIRLGIVAGCKRAVVVISNRYSCALFKKLGFETVSILDLTKLGPEYKGPPLDFNRMNGNRTISIMIKQGLS